MSDHQTTSWTEIATFRLCPHKHKLQYLDRWRSPKLSKPLALGIQWHEILDHHYRGIMERGVPYVDTIVDLLNKNGARDPDHPQHEIGSTLLWMYHGYKRWVESEQVEDREWRIREVEVEFRVPLPGTDIILVGRIDLVVEYRRHFWVVDHKCLADTTPVSTHRGVLPLRNLLPSDKLLSSDGTWTGISAISTKSMDAYELSLRNGKVLVSSLEHKWPVEIPVHAGRYRQETYTTQDLMDLIDTGIKPRLIASLAECRPERALTVAPYVIGAILGDECLTGRGSSVTITKNHDPTIDRVNSLLPDGTVLVPVSSNDPNKAPSFRLYGSIMPYLKELGLLGRLGANKFIPDEYFLGSDQQRRALLSGLLDTDGSVRKGVALYQTGSEQLANDVRRLIESLGGVATIWCNTNPPYQGGIGKPCWDVKMRFPKDWGNPFLHEVKASRFKSSHTTLNERLTIEQIRPVGKRNCIDIEVDASNRLFVVDGVLTHNSVRNLPNNKELDLDDQTPLYIWAMRQAGYDVRGAVLSHTRTYQLKRDMSPEERFQRDWIYRTDNEIETVVQEAIASIQAAYHPDQQHPRHPNPSTCKWMCPYLEPCIGGRKAQHLEVELLKGLGFQHMEPRLQIVRT